MNGIDAYGQTLGDKIIGLKDEVAGKITRNPEKVQHGKEQKSGELKRKQLEEKDVRRDTRSMRLIADHFLRGIERGPFRACRRQEA